MSGARKHAATFSAPAAIDGVPSRRGHFRLESGYHTDVWLTLDGLFADPAAIAPSVETLAAQLRPYDISAIVGPFVGGAFLAHALATVLRARFYHAERGADRNGGLFAATYHVPLASDLRGARVAVVDDVISAGSSVRATISSLEQAGAQPAVVGSLAVLGTAGLEHFSRVNLPVETLSQVAFNLWPPADCPLCRDRIPCENSTA